MGKYSEEMAGLNVRRTTILIVVALCLFAFFALAWVVSTQAFYKPGSDFGYNLGLVGGLLMLSLLFYPLRKRWRFIERIGSMEGWFRYHMVAGILGPVLVLFHSTFQTHSMNGAAAFYSMLLVALSGVVGRFFYRHVHQGLYGRQLTLADTQAELEASIEGMGSVFALQPDIEPRMQAFREDAFRPLGSLHARIWRFLTLRWRSKALSQEIRRDAKRVLKHLGKAQKIPKAELILSYRLARSQIDNFLDAVIKTAQFQGWERLFSFWHVIHIPFLYLLVLSGVFHVLAVHMY